MEIVSKTIETIDNKDSLIIKAKNLELSDEHKSIRIKQLANIELHRK